MKKIILLILLLPILAISQECTTYNDIDSSSYKNDILYASDRGWVTCRDESSPFNPTIATKRIEALKMALLAGGYNLPSTDEQCFDDISPTDDDTSWMNPYVCYGLDNGFLVNRANFLPADSINFAEASKLILRSITNDSYSEEHTDWYQEYLEKMTLYGFEMSPSATINRDYFVYILRTIEADPNKQEEVKEEVVEEEEETPTDDTGVENNETTIDDNTTIEDNNTTENNTTIEVVGERAIGGFEYWFEPYRCFDSTAPQLDLVIESDSVDKNGSRLLDLEFYTTGGSQSCVDTDGETHNLAFGTRWRGEGLAFGNLTPSDSDTPYKRVRVSIPSDGEATEIRLAVITTLGKVMVQSLFIDKNGNITKSKATTYGLNGIEVKDENILSKIKSVIAELESIKLDVSALATRTRSVEDDNALRGKYDAIKQRLDSAKSLLDTVKQAIDNSDEDKESLKREADKIKDAIDEVKNLIDKYKDSADNSQSALDDINRAIDGVIAMMRSGEDSVDETKSYISIKKGRNTISGTIDVTTLPDEVHSIWIVDGGNWYGYSPHSIVRDEIADKYLLIEDRVANYKGMIVFAMNDTQIESLDVVDDTPHSYGLGYTLHGTNGEAMSASDIVCDEPNQLIMVAKIRGDEPSVYVPDREIGGIENFEYLDSDDGYFVLCDKDKR